MVIHFDEGSFRSLGDDMSHIFMQIGRELLNPHHSRNEWLIDYAAFGQILHNSMNKLDDSNLDAVNRCQYTLPRLVTYHKVINKTLSRAGGAFQWRCTNHI